MNRSNSHNGTNRYFAQEKKPGSLKEQSIPRGIYSIDQLKKFQYKASNKEFFSSFMYRFDVAVSPVVGIMLMLTVTLIIAAIVSGFAGGLANTQPKPPSLLIDASLVNGSSLDIAIISVSDGIPTKDLKFITEWRAINGTLFRNVVDAGSGKVDNRRYPIGLTANTTTVNINDFGNYSLLAGTRITANTTESLNVLFTQYLSAGDNVKIQFVHIPSGSIIAQKELTVKEG